MSRGFGSPNYDKALQRAVVSLGGKAAHVQRTAHEWTPETAKIAGRKGGRANAKRLREAGKGAA